MTYDISNTKKLGDTSVLKVRDPSSGLIIEGYEIDVYGIDSKIFRDAMKSKAQESLIKRTKRIDIEKEERRTIETLAALIVDWRGFVEHGSPLPYSRDNAVRLLTEYVWLREQVDEFVSDRSNFLLNA